MAIYPFKGEHETKENLLSRKGGIRFGHAHSFGKHFQAWVIFSLSDEPGWVFVGSLTKRPALPAWLLLHLTCYMHLT
jgi:hypothetical protein